MISQGTTPDLYMNTLADGARCSQSPKTPAVADCHNAQFKLSEISDNIATGLIMWQRSPFFEDAVLQASEF